MPSVVEQAKRALVAALKSLARTYGVRVDLTQDSPDAAVRSACRRVLLRAHPDKGGSAEHAQRLSGAKGAWEAAQRASTGGRPVGAATTDLAPAAPRKAFRIQGKGVLLTYFRVVDLAQWHRFKAHVVAAHRLWGVCHFCLTLEATKKGALHFHMMLQFAATKNCTIGLFAFEDLKMRADPHDILGEGWSGRKLQESLNRGFFYVYADKIGTQRDEAGLPKVKVKNVHLCRKTQIAPSVQ